MCHTFDYSLYVVLQLRASFVIYPFTEWIFGCHRFISRIYNGVHIQVCQITIPGEEKTKINSYKLWWNIFTNLGTGLLVKTYNFVQIKKFLQKLNRQKVV